MSGVLAKLVLAIASLVLSVVIQINAFGLTIVSWHWLVWGSIGNLILLGIVTHKDET